MDCRACLELWLIVLLRRLCYYLSSRVRPRWASGTRAPSGDASDLCTNLDPRSNIIDGLASREVHHRRGLSRSLRVALADFRPAHLDHPHRGTSAIVFHKASGVFRTVMERISFREARLNRLAAAQRLGSGFKEQVVLEVANERIGQPRRRRGPMVWFLRRWGTGSRDGGRTTQSPWIPRSVRSIRRRIGGCAPGYERRGAGKQTPGQKRLPSSRGGPR